uniref:ABC transporter ATP-binding protein n=1 Tax=Thermosporothrix sp. COM3 TaxID=2490863 RepID=A0A455SLR6_9CHLR|nr:ABC transporter ATP-binding protein [Thermosporothrix sp. COM3]
MLRIVGLCKAYGQIVALQDVDLSIEAGEIVGLIGPNGAGKTTLVSLVAGLRKADAGSVTIQGIDALRFPEKVRPLLGVAPQDSSFYPGLLVRDNLRFFGELYGLRGRDLRLRVDEIASALGLETLLQRRARELSGGQQRRLHTALALLHRPRLLFLDEPTVGADVQTRGQILEIVQQLAAEGCAVCYCSHYFPEIEQLHASIAVLEAGRVLVRSSLQEFITAHGTTQVRLTFEGEAPYQPGWICEGECAFIPTERPTKTITDLLQHSAEIAARVRTIEIVQPDLESAYLAVTGRIVPGMEVERCH